MATIIRPELSKKNKYFIDKHRYYELKHFCLQYPIWKKEYSELYSLKGRTYDSVSKSNTPDDPTGKIVEDRSSYFERMKLIEQAAFETDPDLANYILKAVTEGLSFSYLKSKLGIPCGKDTYYDRYRRFFKLLDASKNYI